MRIATACRTTPTRLECRRMEILRCQVRVATSSGTAGRCGAEPPTRLPIVYPEIEGTQEPHGIVTCEEHRTEGSEDIIGKASHEVRELCEWLGGKPAF